MHVSDSPYLLRSSSILCGRADGLVMVLGTSNGFQLLPRYLWIQVDILNRSRRIRVEVYPRTNTSPMFIFPINDLVAITKTSMNHYTFYETIVAP